MKTNITIVELAKIPSEFQTPRKEKNLLTYHDFHILVASQGDTVLGSVRVGIHTNNVSQGLVADLFVVESALKKGLEEKLIENAEMKLKECGVSLVDALCLDGIGHVRHLYNSGFKPFRRTVYIHWNLKDSLNLVINPEFQFKTFIRFDPTLVDCIADSMQPYWTPWKEHGDTQAQKGNIAASLKQLFKDSQYRIFGAYQQQSLVGLVDGRVATPNLTFGVCIRKDFEGRKLGSTLLKTSFDYLKTLGLEQASTIATSGLDDYDPQIYLYTLSAAGKIDHEYIDLQKTL